jgi:hypothetical protein
MAPTCAQQAGDLAVRGIEHAVGVHAVGAAGAAAGGLVVVGVDLVAQQGVHVVDFLAQQRLAAGLAPEGAALALLA